MKTFSAKAHEVKRDWYIVDATDMVLGRLASAIAHRLRGKHKAILPKRLPKALRHHLVPLQPEHKAPGDTSRSHRDFQASSPANTCQRSQGRPSSH